MLRGELNKRRWLIWPLVAVGIAAWMQVAIESSLIQESGEICAKNEYTGQKECATYHIVFVVVRQIGKTLNDYAGLLAAIATIVIAWFTRTLFQATDQLKRIAEKQISVLTDTERPWLFVEKTIISMHDHAPPPNNWIIRLRWRNVGRMPAIIESLVFNIRSEETLPDVPDYTSASDLVFSRSLAPGKAFKTNKVGAAPALGVKDGEYVQLIFFGRMIYKDLSGKEHRTGFALHMSPHMPACSVYPKAGYEYWD